MREFLEALRRALRSPAFKFFLNIFLILLLVVPLLLVCALVWERETRAQAVRAEVGQLWGPEQQLIGPFLIVPYTVRIQTVQGDKRFEQLQERAGGLRASGRGYPGLRGAHHRHVRDPARRLVRRRRRCPTGTAGRVRRRPGASPRLRSRCVNAVAMLRCNERPSPDAVQFQPPAERSALPFPHH
jgi:hypothetical protein